MSFACCEAARLQWLRCVLFHGIWTDGTGQPARQARILSVYCFLLWRLQVHLCASAIAVVIWQAGVALQVGRLVFFALSVSSVFSGGLSWCFGG